VPDLYIFPAVSFSRDSVLFVCSPAVRSLSFSLLSSLFSLYLINFDRLTRFDPIRLAVAISGIFPVTEHFDLDGGHN
jgi:hypothetical protein